jgi:[citrate (pro-3S)-lyase] ligase
VETQAKLDLTIFSRYIAPALNIQKRFVGEEPYCQVTSTYNKIMKQQLPSMGIEVEEVNRLTSDGKAISASRVREQIRIGNIKAIKSLVPDTTYKFLLSKEAGEIIRHIQTVSQRH